MIQRFLLLGAVVAVVATVGAVSRDAGAGRATAAREPSANCTVAQKAKRVRALRAYKAKMRAARRAYFRTHRSTKARKAFVKRQQAKLRKLKRAAACTVPPSIPPLPDTHVLTVTKAGDGAGTVTSRPAGIDCGTTCSANFSPGIE